jgi:hypothetical protein
MESKRDRFDKGAPLPELGHGGGVHLFDQDPANLPLFGRTHDGAERASEQFRPSPIPGFAIRMGDLFGWI